MASVTFDTLKFLDDLERAQVPKEQARAIIQVVRESHDAADVATKGDLRELELRLRNDIDHVRKDMETMGNRLIIKLSAVMATLIGLAGAVLAVVNKL